LSEIRAEITANVWQVTVEEGQMVAEGDEICILESMKMEIPVVTETPGVVRELHVAPEQTVQEGDLISSWVSYTATHQADFAGVPASGRRVKFAEWDLFRVSGGKIVEITQYCDLFTIMSQIGALPTAAPA